MNNDIQGWFDFANIYDKAVDEAPPGSTLIEIGVWKGKSLCYLAARAKAADKQLNVIGIDNWAHVDWDGYATIQQVDRLHGEYRTPLEQCRANLEDAGVLDFVTLIESDSIKAADLFADNSVRFIFVDDTHNSPHVEKELRAWLPKIKRPTWIAGHDYPGLIYDGVQAVLPHATQDGTSWIATIE